jgi:hypothetical protein
MMNRQVATLLALMGSTVACGDSALGPSFDGTPTFSEAISLESFESSITGGSARVEIKLVPGTLLAREVEIKEPEELSDREEIESPVTAVNGALGTVTLAISGFIVSFDGTTEFRSETGQALTQSEFVGRLETKLANGQQPAIEAKRPAPATPQAPTDPTFLATRIEFDDEADEPEIEINVDVDNLIPNDSPPPDAWLRLLGMEIAIRASDGTTELEKERDRDEEEVDFEGIISTVDAASSTVTLADGTVLMLVSDTEIKREGDDDNLPSLSAVAGALDRGALVEADGEGLITSTNPLTLLVSQVEFEIEDDADDVPGEVDFEGRVDSVEEVAGTLTLANGTVILVDANTRFEDAGDDDEISSLADVVAALARGDFVEADGEGVVEGTDPLTIRAVELELEVDD